MHHQIQALWIKVERWVGVLKIYSLPKEELMAYINSTIMKTLEYPMEASTLTLED